MKPLSEKKKLNIVDLYLEGYPYQMIAKKTGASTGSITNLINDFKEGNMIASSSALDMLLLSKKWLSHGPMERQRI